jgi:hypothetical protein
MEINRIVVAAGAAAALALSVSAPVAATAASSSRAPVVYAGNGWHISGHLPQKITVPGGYIHIGHWTFNHRLMSSGKWEAYAHTAHLHLNGRTSTNYVAASGVRSRNGVRYYKHLYFWIHHAWTLRNGRWH